MSATCKRDDLAWALSAVLPHAGSGAATSCIGMHEHAGTLFVYATDKYTAGIARLPVEGTFSPVVISTGVRNGEAGELEKYVRPGKVAEKSNTLELLTAELSSHGYDSSYDDRELHVAVHDEHREGDSAVFWQRPAALLQVDLWGGISRTLELYRERLATELREYTFSPALLARFSRAGRYGNDRLRMHPYAIAGARLGTVATVTVGEHFLGAIGGMEHEEGMESILESWLPQQQLQVAA